MKHYITYALGFPHKSGKSAALGTIWHKTAELRALGFAALKNKRKTFTDDNFGKVSAKDAINPEITIPLCFEYYKNIETHINFTNADLKTLFNWYHNTWEKYPEYDPQNLNVIKTEQYFDFEIDKPWAEYNYDIDGEKINGRLFVKGTMDQIVDHGDGVYELVDFKTGQMRKDFATGEEKTLEYMKGDNQLLLYFIALKHLFPDKEFILTLFYINQGGAFSVLGSNKMLEDAWAMLQLNFEKISKNRNPRQLDPSNQDWRCKYCCNYSKPYQDTGLSFCQFMKKEIILNGIDKTTDRYIKRENFNSYSEGGGRKNIDKE